MRKKCWPIGRVPIGTSFLQAVENDSVEVIGRSDYDMHPLFGGADENFLNNVKQLEASGKMVRGFQFGNRMVGVIF